MDNYFFILTTIDLFVLGFMCFLTKLSESLNKRQKRGFFLAFALIAVISVLEVITIVVDRTPPGWRWLNILSNYLGFGLTPAVPLCLVYVLDKKSIIRRGFKVAVCCEGVYLLFLAATLPDGPVFSVSRENLYARGGCFFIYVIMYYASMLYLMVATVRTAAAFQNRSRPLIYPLIFFLTAETAILCLAEIAACLKKAYARCGYCYRIGGDEFCVLLKDRAQEAPCAEEFLRRLEQRRKALPFLPRVSFGSAAFSGEDVVTVKDRADREMYRYKSQRKAST